MKKRFMYGMVCIVISGLLSGCIVIGGSPKCCPETVYMQGDATIQEIDAAGRLFSDSDKEAVYLAIAQRPGLSCGAQVHLVKAAYRLFSDSSKEAVLLALIYNPDMCAGTKAKILDNLHRLFSDSSKRKILDAFNERVLQPAPMMVVPPVEAIPPVEAQQ
ncbi:MAG: hypothetical protein JXA82_04370 [Sedimentisphaerales bacterium]|nr:hypothetical protein [Sedimentisphaerales bacterium]